MNLANKKEELIKQYKKNIEGIQQLSVELQKLNVMNLQIEAQIKLIEEIEQTGKERKEIKSN